MILMSLTMIFLNFEAIFAGFAENLTVFYVIFALKSMFLVNL